jgi:hypothetical protein
MVISYSHVVTLWKNAVFGKGVGDHTTVDKWLTYRVVIGYELIDQGKRFSPKDPKDQDLSMDKFTYYSMGYTGCGLDDFDKNGERRSVNFKFHKRYSEKAWFFFRSSKFHTDLLQPIRNYIGIIHEDYMKMLRMMSWKLDNVLHLRDQPVTEDIETLPLHFETHHWETLYNNERDWDSLSWGKILHSIKDWETSRVNPPGQNSPKPTSSTNEKTSDVNSSGKKKNCHSAEYPTAIEIFLW